MDTFRKDDHWQRGMRDHILKPFYNRCDGKCFFLDEGDSAVTLQRLGVDTLFRKDGKMISIEEKIVRWPKRDTAYTAFVLETESCTTPGREKSGWMRYGEANWLFYAFEQADHDSLKIYFIDFFRLKEWFWKNLNKYRDTDTDQINQTRCKIVPIGDVCSSVPFHGPLLLRP